MAKERGIGKAETKVAKRRAGLFSFMGSGQGVRTSTFERYPAAQEIENYAEDAIAVLADKFGQPLLGMTFSFLPSFPITDSKRRFHNSRGHCSFLEIKYSKRRVSTLFLTSGTIYPSLQHW